MRASKQGRGPDATSTSSVTSGRPASSGDLWRAEAKVRGAFALPEIPGQEMTRPREAGYRA